jgi:hypothetical protein
VIQPVFEGIGEACTLHRTDRANLLRLSDTTVVRKEQCRLHGFAFGKGDPSFVSRSDLGESGFVSARDECGVESHPVGLCDERGAD